MSLNTHGNALPEGYRLLWYRIGRVLGQGGFGITYEAFDTNLEKSVAIKEYLPKEFAVREQDSTVRPFTEDRKKMFDWGLDRFLQEARTLAKFHHPNIVLVHNVFEENGTAYMVMEFEQGEALDKLFKFGRLESEKDLLRITYPLLDGLEHMHEAGFIHRDIKPPNIYVRLDGSPTLIDFGSARFAIGGETKTLTSLITPGFAPYEQYHDESGKQGSWTDIYSLGATLYAGINRGRAPMDAIVRGNARIEGKPDPMESATELGKGRYSEAFLVAIDTALGFRPEERPQTVAEWRELFPTLGGQPPASKPESRSQAEIPTVIRNKTRVSTVPRRSGIFKWLAVGLIVAGVGGGIYLMKTWQPSIVLAPDQHFATEAERQRKQLEEQARLIQEAEVKKQKEEQERLATQLADERARLEEARAQKHREEQQRQEQLARLVAEEKRRLEKQVKRQAEKARLEKLAEEKQRQTQALKDKLARAQAKKQTQINQLLVKAAEDMAAGRLANTPDKNDALSRYQQILKIDPANKDALKGIAILTEKLATQTSQAQPRALAKKPVTQPPAAPTKAVPVSFVVFSDMPIGVDSEEDSGHLGNMLKELTMANVPNDMMIAAGEVRVDENYFASPTQRADTGKRLCGEGKALLLMGANFEHPMRGQSEDILLSAFFCRTGKIIEKKYRIYYDAINFPAGGDWRGWIPDWKDSIQRFLREEKLLEQVDKRDAAEHTK